MKIAKIRLANDRRKIADVVINGNNIICDKIIDNDGLCCKLYCDAISNDLEIKFDAIKFELAHTNYFDDEVLYRLYTLTANINYNNYIMSLEFIIDDFGKRNKDIVVRLCDSNHCGCVACSIQNHIIDDIDNDFIPQLINNNTNIDYYLDSEKVDEDTFKLYCALNN